MASCVRCKGEERRGRAVGMPVHGPVAPVTGKQRNVTGWALNRKYARCDPAPRNTFVRPVTTIEGPVPRSIVTSVQARLLVMHRQIDCKTPAIRPSDEEIARMHLETGIPKLGMRPELQPPAGRAQPINEGLPKQLKPAALGDLQEGHRTGTHTSRENPFTASFRSNPRIHTARQVQDWFRNRKSVPTLVPLTPFPSSITQPTCTL